MNPTAEWKELFPGYELTFAAPAPPSTPQGPPVQIIERAARRAGICDFLAEAVRAGAPLPIVINDTHRFTDSASAIEAICRICDAEGLAPRVRLLVATGSHTFDDPEEIAGHERQALGGRSSAFIERAWHNAQNPPSLKRAGGVRIHHWIAECRHALAVGSMEAHYFAGVTGAHKTLSAGILAFDDLSENHKAALSPEARGLRLEGNPIYEGLASIVRALEAEGRRFFALNLLQANGRVVFCAAGSPLATVSDSLPRVRQTFGFSLRRPVDFAVSIVRPPLDRDLYQADKGIKNVENAVRDGGLIVLEAACRGGVGIDRFCNLLRRAATHDEALALVEREGYVLGDHKAVRLRALTHRRGVGLAAIAPGLPPEAAAIAGITLFADRPAAARWIGGRLGRNAQGAIVEDAGNVALETASSALSRKRLP